MCTSCLGLLGLSRLLSSRCPDQCDERVSSSSSSIHIKAVALVGLLLLSLPQNQEMHLSQSRQKPAEAIEPFPTGEISWIDGHLGLWPAEVMDWPYSTSSYHFMFQSSTQLPKASRALENVLMWSISMRDVFLALG